MKHIKKDPLLSREVFREPNIPVREEKILHTIQSSMQKLEMSQLEQPLDIWEFLYLQSQILRILESVFGFFKTSRVLVLGISGWKT